MSVIISWRIYKLSFELITGISSQPEKAIDIWLLQIHRLASDMEILSDNAAGTGALNGLIFDIDQSIQNKVVSPVWTMTMITWLMVHAVHIVHRINLPLWNVQISNVSSDIHFTKSIDVHQKNISTLIYSWWVMADMMLERSHVGQLAVYLFSN